MTEDQRNIGYMLELAHATRKVARPIEWFATEMRQVRGTVDAHGLMDVMMDRGLISRERDGLGVWRYTITDKGVAVWDAL